MAKANGLKEDTATNFVFLKSEAEREESNATIPV
jgi:hypothetical protein